MQSNFLNKITEQEALLKRQLQRFDFLGYGKLLFILLLGGSLFIAFQSNWSAPWLLTSGLVLAVLLVLWVCHSRLQTQIDFTQGLIAIAAKQVARISGDWVQFLDTGAEFLQPDHPYGGGFGYCRPQIPVSVFK